jgi:tetratricopeptide (TPR) repeat protein
MLSARVRPYLEQALAIYREVLGEKHPDTATSLNNLGMLLQAMGDYAGARLYFEQALAILEEALPPEHPYIQLVRKNLEEVKRKLREGG